MFPNRYDSKKEYKIESESVVEGGVNVTERALHVKIDRDCGTGSWSGEIRGWEKPTDDYALNCGNADKIGFDGSRQKQWYARLA
jgi:hypothetical protein